jgi:pilus assembly protein CpaC
VKIAALVIYIIIILVATPQAQKPVAFSGSPGSMSAGPAATPPDATSIDLLVGRSTILNVGSAIARVSLTVPDVADAMVTAPQELLIHGKTPGTISLFVWDRAGGIKTYEINVRRDLKQLVDQMTQLFPGEAIAVVGSGKDVVISGLVSSKYVIDKAAEVAAGYVEKKENVVNLLKQQEGIASNQVMLRVRFAEVSRSAMQELGASFILDRFKTGKWDARSTTQQFAAPDFDSSKPGQLNFSDFLNLFIFNSKEGIGAVVKALQGKGLFQSLAEPNLIALNGKEASFLAGGEYPYPVVQPGGTGNAVTIMFKEFGVRLHFTPTILGTDLINLKVRPEVSSLDFSNAITLNGFRVPALSSRRTETEVELQDGQTFAIAGLMNNTLNSTMDKIPGIGDIPVLGYLFRSRAYQKNQTELVVMITPQILRRGSNGVSSGLPAAVEPFLGAPRRTVPQPAPYVGSPVYPVRPGGAPSGRTESEPPAPVPVPAVVPTPAPAVPVPAPVQPAMEAAPAAAPAIPASTAGVPASTPEASVTTPAPAADVPAAEVKTQPAPKPDRKAAGREREAQKQAAAAQKAADKKAAQEKAAADKKAAEEKAAADKKAAAEQVVADRKAAIAQARQQKLDEERAKRDAEVAKKTAEEDRKKAEEQQKHDKLLLDAAARLKAAQAAYQAELDKKKGLQ